MGFVVYFFFTCLPSVKCHHSRIPGLGTSGLETDAGERSLQVLTAGIYSPFWLFGQFPKSLQGCLHTCFRGGLFGAPKSQGAQLSSLVPYLGDLPAIP